MHPGGLDCQLQKVVILIGMETPETETARLTAKGTATRERIVATAAGLMYQRGVAGTSTEDVQRAAGVSASQIYHYFDSKKSLVRAVIAHQTQTVLNIQVPLLGRLDSFEALEAWRDFMVEVQQRRHCQGGCPIGSLAGELADTDPDARTDLAAGFARWETAIRQGLQAMQQRGELDTTADPARLALATLAAIQGGLLLTQTRRDTDALEAVLDAMIDRIRSLATTRPPRPPSMNPSRRSPAKP
jgi:TetR/AcrR family transcriptional repressor of nem operon